MTPVYVIAYRNIYSGRMTERVEIEKLSTFRVRAARADRQTLLYLGYTDGMNATGYDIEEGPIANTIRKVLEFSLRAKQRNEERNCL